MYMYDRPAWTGEVYETECFFPTWINKESAAHVQALIDAHHALYGEERIGHAVGGVCPFAVNEDCDVYLDESLRRFDVVYPACGSSNSAIALAPDELATYTPGSTWIDVCKLPE